MSFGEKNATVFFFSCRKSFAKMHVNHTRLSFSQIFRNNYTITTFNYHTYIHDDIFFLLFDTATYCHLLERFFAIYASTNSLWQLVKMVLFDIYFCYVGRLFENLHFVELFFFFFAISNKAHPFIFPNTFYGQSICDKRNRMCWRWNMRWQWVIFYGKK